MVCMSESTITRTRHIGHRLSRQKSSSLSPFNGLNHNPPSQSSRSLSLNPHHNGHPLRLLLLLPANLRRNKKISSLWFHWKLRRPASHNLRTSQQQLQSPHQFYHRRESLSLRRRRKSPSLRRRRKSPVFQPTLCTRLVHRSHPRKSSLHLPRLRKTRRQLRHPRMKNPSSGHLPHPRKKSPNLNPRKKSPNLSPRKKSPNLNPRKRSPNLSPRKKNLSQSPRKKNLSQSHLRKMSHRNLAGSKERAEAPGRKLSANLMKRKASMGATRSARKASREQESSVALNAPVTSQTTPTTA